MAEYIKETKITIHIDDELIKIELKDWAPFQDVSFWHPKTDSKWKTRWPEDHWLDSAEEWEIMAQIVSRLI